MSSTKESPGQLKLQLTINKSYYNIIPTFIQGNNGVGAPWKLYKGCICTSVRQYYRFSFETSNSVTVFVLSTLLQFVEQTNCTLCTVCPLCTEIGTVLSLKPARSRRSHWKMSHPNLRHRNTICTENREFPQCWQGEWITFITLYEEHIQLS